MSNRGRYVPHEQLELLPGPVTKDRGELRQLSGSDYDLQTSVMHAQVAPGSGPRRHRHPHAEIFVLHSGQGRFDVEGEFIDAVAGDMVIIPPEAWHSFVSTGDGPLGHTAIHENRRAVTIFEDGSRRD